MRGVQVRNEGRTSIISHFNLPLRPYARSKMFANALDSPLLAASSLRMSYKTLVFAPRVAHREYRTLDIRLSLQEIRLWVCQIDRTSCAAFIRKKCLGVVSVESMARIKALTVGREVVVD